MISPKLHTEAGKKLKDDRAMMNQGKYIINCPWCGSQMALDKAEYYGKVDTHKIIYRCTTCKAQWSE